MFMARKIFPFMLLGCLSSGPALSGSETGMGNAEAGKAYVQAHCAGCHALGRESTVSPNVKAPPFVLVAKSELVTKREINIWLQSAHPDMPDLTVPASSRADIIAFIDSLAEDD